MPRSNDLFLRRNGVRQTQLTSLSSSNIQAHLIEHSIRHLKLQTNDNELGMFVPFCESQLAAATDRVACVCCRKREERTAAIVERSRHGRIGEIVVATT